MSVVTTILFILFFGLVALVIVALSARSLLGLVIVSEREVGVVVKKFGPRLAPGQLIALKGEAGYQAEQDYAADRRPAV